MKDKELKEFIKTTLLKIVKEALMNVENESQPLTKTFLNKIDKCLKEE